MGRRDRTRTDDDRLHPALEASLRGEEQEPEQEETEGPRVVVARLSDLGPVPPPLAAHASRPIWFVVEDEADEANLFLRHPEKPVPRAASASVFERIRAFAERETEVLQALLGVTTSIEIGWHTSASYEDVVGSFEEDGFEVIEDAIRGGEWASKD